MALTDHDTVAGLVEAKIAAETLGMRLFPAIELSTQWQKKCFHVVGLNINEDYPPLASALAELQSVRMQRAEKIAEKLAKKNIAGAFDAVIDAAKGGNGLSIGGRLVKLRSTVFLQFLKSPVEIGRASCRERV